MSPFVSLVVVSLLVWLPQSAAQEPAPSASWASQAFFDPPLPARAWRHENFATDDYIDSEQAEAPIKNYNGSSPTHGTYVTKPYLAFIKTSDGKRVLVTDSTFQAELAPVSDHQKQFTLVPHGDTPAQDLTAVRINFDVEGCTDRFPCFRLSGTQELGLKEGTYKPVPRLSPPEDNVQTWKDVFQHPPPNLDYSRACWNLTRMNLENLQLDSCDGEKIFIPPDGTSKDYFRVIQTETFYVPYGWRYRDIILTSQRGDTTMITTGRQLMDSHSSTIGFNAGINLFFFSIGGSHNEEYSQRREQMYKDELTRAHTQTVHTQSVLLLDKRNVLLNPDFKVRVHELNRPSATDSDFRDFFDAFGTHFAYAVTSGSIAISNVSFTGRQLESLYDHGVKIGSAVNTGVKGNVEGVDFGFDFGASTGSEKENYDKYNSVVQSSSESLVCYGGLTCSKDGGSGGNVPILLDLRPIWELLGPPFYKDEATVLKLRSEMSRQLHDYVFYDSSGPLDEKTIRFLKASVASPTCQDSAAMVMRNGGGTGPDPSTFFFYADPQDGQIHCRPDAEIELVLTVNGNQEDKRTIAIDNKSSTQSVVSLPNKRNADSLSIAGALSFFDNCTRSRRSINIPATAIDDTKTIGIPLKMEMRCGINDRSINTTLTLSPYDALDLMVGDF